MEVPASNGRADDDADGPQMVTRYLLRLFRWVRSSVTGGRSA